MREETELDNSKATRKIEWKIFIINFDNLFFIFQNQSKYSSLPSYSLVLVCHQNKRNPLNWVIVNYLICILISDLITYFPTNRWTLYYHLQSLTYFWTFPIPLPFIFCPNIATRHSIWNTMLFIIRIPIIFIFSIYNPKSNEFVLRL